MSRPIRSFVHKQRRLNPAGKLRTTGIALFLLRLEELVYFSRGSSGSFRLRFLVGSFLLRRRRCRRRLATSQHKPTLGPGEGDCPDPDWTIP